MDLENPTIRIHLRDIDAREGIGDLPFGKVLVRQASSASADEFGSEKRIQGIESLTTCIGGKAMRDSIVRFLYIWWIRRGGGAAVCLDSLWQQTLSHREWIPSRL